jgi:hypothetical protein
MNYDTHEKTAVLFSLASIPVLQLLHVFPTFNGTVESVAVVAASAVVTLKAGAWGARYPDCDLVGSGAAKHDLGNRIIARIMHIFGVVHRGKFTHSLDIITLTFGILYLAARYGLPFLLNTNMEHIQATEDTKMLLFLLTGGHILSGMLQLWVVSAYVGALSHLFADSSTTEGIRIFFWQKHNHAWVPAHFSILGWKPFGKAFNTSSEVWEYGLYALVIRVGTLAAGVLALLVMAFGTGEALSIINGTYNQALSASHKIW